jgi:hypothetical protein
LSPLRSRRHSQMLFRIHLSQRKKLHAESRNDNCGGKRSPCAMRGVKRADAAWRILRQQRHASDLSKETWQPLRTQRKAELGQREQADATWRHQLQQLRERWLQLPLVTAWIAILVIMDNCTRQCLGLPLFVVGHKVTAELIVEALRA